MSEEELWFELEREIETGEISSADASQVWLEVCNNE